MVYPGIYTNRSRGMEIRVTRLSRGRTEAMIIVSVRNDRPRRSEPSRRKLTVSALDKIIVGGGTGVTGVGPGPPKWGGGHEGIVGVGVYETGVGVAVAGRGVRVGVAVRVGGVGEQG